MLFVVLDRGEYPQRKHDIFCLRRDNWDDFGFKTSFYAFYYDESGHEHSIGPIKIGCRGMNIGRIFDNMPKVFSLLPDMYFSLGQTESYYESLSKLGPNVREEILRALKDIAYDINLFSSLESEKVVHTSLMRDISIFALKYQLNRMAHGGLRLSKYNFLYRSPEPTNPNDFTSIELEFDVVPDSNPPSNIHVLIGRNGTGKTRLIQNMIRSIRFDDKSYGLFRYAKNTRYSDAKDQFANILCVAFSPFDDFSCTFQGESSIPYTYIGLDKTSHNLLDAITDQFWQCFVSCMTSPQKKKRWLSTINILKSDSAFTESQIDFLAQNVSNEGTLADRKSLEFQVKQVFSRLSSGHKVILLIITSCVDKLEERSVVFIDEPENHLHPPLLAAFIRALSYLLIDRNGVAIISTHSPVILQEVPNNCVWALRRYGNHLVAERIPTETFGSNIGMLTSEVFGLEVTESGFHQLLNESVSQLHDYDRIVEKFNQKLGDEAKGILRVLLALDETKETTI